MSTYSKFFTILFLVPMLSFGQRLVDPDEGVPRSSKKPASSERLALKFGFTDILRGEIPVSLEWAALQQLSVEVGASALTKNFYYNSEFAFGTGFGLGESIDYTQFGESKLGAGYFAAIKFYYQEECFIGNYFALEYSSRKYLSEYNNAGAQFETFQDFQDIAILWGASWQPSRRVVIEGFTGIGYRTVGYQYSDSADKVFAPGEGPRLYVSESNQIFFRIGYKVGLLL